MSGMQRAFVPWLTASPGLLLSLTLLVAPAVLAQEAPAPTPEPEAQKMDVTGFVDVYYEYNFNKVDPALRNFDVRHNAFSISAADVALAKGATTDSRLGFRTELAFGKTADLIASYEPETNGPEIWKNILQAYGSVLAGPKLQIDVGKFLGPLGAEVMAAQDDWDYSRSVLFGYAIPFYHVGVRATLPLNDKVSLAGYVVNGWNNATDFGGKKTVGIGATLEPSAKLSWVGGS